MIMLREYIRTLLESQQAKQYIRFGLWPENERSKRGAMASTDEDWEDFEEGVSVYDTFWNDKVSKWEIHGGNMNVTAVTLRNFIGRFKRGTTPAFLVTGDVIGTGLDGEPLLNNVKKIKELKCEEIYVPELDFGSPYNSKEDCGIDPKENIYHVKIFHNDKIRYGEEPDEEMAGYESEILNMIEKEMGGQIEFVGTKQGYYFYRAKGRKYGPTTKFMTNVGSLAISNKELPI